MKPFACPICRGKGTVAIDFYADGKDRLINGKPMCRSCGGSGVVWGWDPVQGVFDHDPINVKKDYGDQ